MNVATIVGGSDLNHQCKSKLTPTTVALGGPASYGSYAVTKRLATIDATLDLRGKRVLDLGCGNGCYTAELARRAASVCAADVHMPYLRAFSTQIPRVQAAGENLPFAPGSFDVITMIEVLEHTHCDSRVLEECFRILKPGGLLTLFVPNKLYPFESHPCHIGGLRIGPNIPFVSWLPEFLHKRLCHARIYTRRKLFAMGKNAGLQVQNAGYIFPPLDSLRLPFKESYRRFARSLEHSPFAMFGVSIFAIFKKPERSTKTAGLLLDRHSSSAPSFKTLGVRVNAIQISDVVAYMEQWIHERGRCYSIAATGMHGVVEAQRDPHFKEILNATDLVVPDGTPLVWVGRRQGHDLPRRVYGPDLMLAFCEETQGQGYRHFFYGGEPGLAEQLARSLRRRFPGMQVAGTYSPPFRPLTNQEDSEIVTMISRAAPDVLWVGLGTPKQERWMHEHGDRLNVPAVVGVGAAFDMISGRHRQAPRWMREHGLEWLFRLFQEPRRLWRRYLIYGAEFIAWIVLENLGLKKFAPNTNEGKPQGDALP
jgi:N-acetylglucosaminyldiphosphoundecaprenol N-acetyl-beta-D-mannosaminyltransferase